MMAEKSDLKTQLLNNGASQSTISDFSSSYHNRVHNKVHLKRTYKKEKP
jgi:hypothetical protein